MKRKILLCVTGSIAAYKAAALVRLFVKAGDEVRVAMTPAACEFVRPLVFQTLSRNPVAVGQFAPAADWRPSHVAAAEWADVALVAPATANTIAKLAHGIADNYATATLLATRAPLFVAPAMNDGMWENAATRANIETLRSRGARIVMPGDGDLACGSAGAGRMAEPEEIFKEIAR